MVMDRRRGRGGWVFSVRVPPGRADRFPHFSDGQVMAVLPGTTSRDVIEAAMIVLAQSLILVGDDDRFDYVAKTAPHKPEGNAAQRHFELDAGGAMIVASKSSVRMVDGHLEWKPEPWPDGMTAESFEALQRERGLR